MKVRCVKLFDSLGAPQKTSSWLTIGNIYVVLTIESGSRSQWMLRLLGDGKNGVALFPLESFDIVSAAVSPAWIASWGDNGVFQLAPERWTQPGFWARFYDLESDAVRIFEEERKLIESYASGHDRLAKS